jgi:hypothetical protein
MIPCGTTFEFEYLGEFEMEIKNMRLIHEKNQRQKISCYCTFKGTLIHQSQQVFYNIHIQV